MRLSKLAGLERKKIEDELSEVQALIASLKSILASAKSILAVVKKELIELGEKYGDDRRTRIVKGGVQNISTEDLVPDEDSMLVLTQGGYVKRTNPSEYRRQKRGGVGVVDIATKEEDIVTHFLVASAHSDLLFFTNFGKAYQLKMYDIPEGKRATKGKSIMNFLPLAGSVNQEQVTVTLHQRIDVLQAMLNLDPMQWTSVGGVVDHQLIRFSISHQQPVVALVTPLRHGVEGGRGSRAHPRIVVQAKSTQHDRRQGQRR